MEDKEQQKKHIIDIMHLDEESGLYEAGQPLHEPMTQSQYERIESLLSNAVLTDEVKEGYSICLDSKLSYEEAEGIIAELKAVQLDNINMARSGKLRQVDLGKALQRLTKMDNT